MVLGIFGGALKTFTGPNLNFIISLAVAIGVVYTCVSPWLDDDDSDDVFDNLDREISKRSSRSSPVIKIRVKKRRIVKLIPELTEFSQKNQDDGSTKFLSFKCGSENISQLKNIIYATTFKSKGTQTDFASSTIDNYIDSNDLHNSIEYREKRRSDPPKIGVSNKQKIVKPPRKHPPISRSEKMLAINSSEDRSNNRVNAKLYNSLYPEVHVIHNEDSKSFKSVIGREENSKTFPAFLEGKLSYLEVKKLIEAENNSNAVQKSKTFRSLIKKCRRMLNFNDFDLNINTSESKSASKSWFSITSALGSQPAGHSTLIDVNLSGEATAGGQDEDYNSPEVIRTRPKPGEKVFFADFQSEESLKAKNLLVEMNSDERPESRIIGSGDYYYNFCNNEEVDLLVDKSKVDYSKESSRITEFTKDLHQFMKDVKSYFKIPHNFHNSTRNNDNIRWINMSAIKRSTSMTFFNKFNHGNKGCYTFL